MSEQVTIEETEKEIVENFTFLEENGGDRTEYIIDLGLKLPPMPVEFKNDSYKVKGCQSTVWLVSSYKDGLVFFNADSDSVFVKGLISLLVKVLSGHSPDEILDAKLSFINDIGMTSKISMNRGNGLPKMLEQMKRDALAYKVKEAAGN